MTMNKAIETGNNGTYTPPSPLFEQARKKFRASSFPKTAAVHKQHWAGFVDTGKVRN